MTTMGAATPTPRQEQIMGTPDATPVTALQPWEAELMGYAHEGLVEGAPTEVRVFGTWVPVDDWYLIDDVPVIVTRLGTLSGRVIPRDAVRWTVVPEPPAWRCSYRGDPWLASHTPGR